MDINLFQGKGRDQKVKPKHQLKSLTIDEKIRIKYYWIFIQLNDTNLFYKIFKNVASVI